jgi:hypothetical protein
MATGIQAVSWTFRMTEGHDVSAMSVLRLKPGVYPSDA